MTSSDKQQIKENLNKDNLQQQIMDQFDSIHYSLEFETRWGTLIRGFGLGVYGNLYSLYSLGAQGIEDLVYENGIIAGYGFELGSLKLGFSGKFALLVADDPSIPFRIRQSVNKQQILYGYAWGLDAGLIWEPVESLRFGLVLNDFIGSITRESDMSKGTIQDIFDGTIDNPSGGYSFALDMSMGVSWQPQWRVIQPKLSIDFYDIIGLIRTTKGNHSGLEHFYATDVSIFLRHIRAGANLRFWGFFDIGLNYYMEYITLGVGLDIAFFEIFAEVRMKHNFEDIGVNGMLRLKF